MAIRTHVIAQQVTAGGETVSKSFTKSASSSQSIFESIADAQTDYEVILTVDISALESFFMVSTQQVTIETNAVDPGDQETIILKANTPLVWTKSGNQREGVDYPAAPFSGDITKFFIANASGSTADVSIEILQDVSP